jgi:replicative DNA helicase
MSINSPSRGGACQISEVVRDVDAEILDNISNAGTMTGVPTGIQGLDMALGGWQPTDLIVMAGRPGMGKTAVMLNFLDNAARIRYPVGCFSVEMASKQLVYRLISRRTGISYQRMKLGLLNPGQAEFIRQALAEINGLPITIDDRSSITELEIVREARRMKREKNVQMIAIDYLQRIKSARPSRSEAEELGKIVQTFKNLARELEIPVMVLSQLNRKVEERDDKRPMLSDLKSSGDIEQEADIIALLYRDEYYNPETPRKGVIEIDIAKFRNGVTRRYEFGWDGKSQSIFNLSHGGD